MQLKFLHPLHSDEVLLYAKACSSHLPGVVVSPAVFRDEESGALKVLVSDSQGHSVAVDYVIPQGGAATLSQTPCSISPPQTGPFDSAAAYPTLQAESSSSRKDPAIGENILPSSQASASPPTKEPSSSLQLVSEVGPPVLGKVASYLASGSLGLDLSPLALAREVAGSGLTALVSKHVGEFARKLWSVDDNDSPGEQISQQLAMSTAFKLKNGLMNSLGNPDPTSMAEWRQKIQEFMNGPSSSAQIPLARNSDLLTIGGLISAGAPSVTADGLSAARIEDPVVMMFVPDSGYIQDGYYNVLIEGRPAAGVGDNCLGIEKGTKTTIGTGSSTVFLAPMCPPGTSSVPKGSPAKNEEEISDSNEHWLFDLLRPMLGQDDQGQYTALFGTVVLGSPQYPGAGTAGGLSWLVPDKIFGYDLSNYYVYHDVHWGTEGKVDTELGAFFSGIMGAVDPFHVILQTIYSGATTTVMVLGGDES